jgi:hypothetical protein
MTKFIENLFTVLKVVLYVLLMFPILMVLKFLFNGEHSDFIESLIKGLLKIPENTVPKDREQAIGQPDEKGYVQVHHEEVNHLHEHLPSGVEDVDKSMTLNPEVSKVELNHKEDKDRRSLDELLKVLSIVFIALLCTGTGYANSRIVELPRDVYEDMVYYLQQYQAIKAATPEITFSSIPIIQDTSGRVFIKEEATMEIRIKSLQYNITYKPNMKIQKKRQPAFSQFNFGITNSLEFSLRETRPHIGAGLSLRLFHNFHFICGISNNIFIAPGYKINNFILYMSIQDMSPGLFFPLKTF